MFVNIDKFAKLMIESKLSPNQVFLCYLIDKGRLDLLYKYTNEFTFFDYHEVQDIIKKGFLIDANKDKNARDVFTYPDHYIATSSFRELLLTETEEAIEELFDIYPVFIEVNGEKYPAKQTDISKLSASYVKNIKGNLVLHNHIKEIVLWAKDKGCIRTGFEKFIVGKGWEFLEALKDSNSINEDLIYDL